MFKELIKGNKKDVDDDNSLEEGGILLWGLS